MSEIRVLLVDDDPRMLDFLEKKIPWSAYGMRVDGRAENGKKAMDWLADHQADLVVTDIKMPQMDGNAFIRQAKALGPTPAFIVLSSYGDYALVKEAFKQGVWDYVLKVDVDSLVMLDALQTVRERIAHRAAQPQGAESFFAPEPFGPVAKDAPATRKRALDAAAAAKKTLRTALDALDYAALRQDASALLRVLASLRPEKSLVLEIVYDTALYISHQLFDMNLLPQQPAYETPAMRGAIASAANFAVLSAWFAGWLDALAQHYHILRSENLMQVIRVYVDHNFCSEEALRAIPRRFGISPGYLSKQFFKENGVHLKEYTTTLRISLAKKFLIEAEEPIAQIAAAVGYNNPEHFSRSFKGIVGVSPLQYKALSAKSVTERK